MSLSRSPRAFAASLVFASLSIGAAGCGSDPSGTGGTGGAGGTTTTSDPDRDAALSLLPANACDDTLDAVYEGVTAPSPWAASMRGDVVRCAYDRVVTAAEMTAHFTDESLPPLTATTDAYKFRISYWTERNEGEPVLTSASFYLPKTLKGTPPPLLVIGHGSVGVADKCAPSREDPDGFHRDFRTQLYTFIGDGWAVLAPDFPGLGTPGAATWMSSPDEGHAMLDGTRAARKLTKEGFFSDKNAIIGHSNGGHAALSAQSYAKSYGSAGTIDAVVVYAPFWLSNGAWGALVTTIGNALITPAFLSMSMQYFHGHLAAYEGEDKANDAFLPDKAEAIGTFLEGGCWQKVAHDGQDGPGALGLKKGSDAFTTDFTGEVGKCGFDGTCDGPLAAKWKERWTTDRPPPDPSIPIILWHGAKDDFLTPGFALCGVDRLQGQGADLTVCIDAEGDHSSLISSSADWVHSYLESVLLGAGDGPAPCVGVEALGADAKCSVPIPNSVDPGEP